MRSAIFDDCAYASPHISAVIAPATSRPSGESYGSAMDISSAPRLA